jgi:pyridoxal 5'-phosphate synthase pdxT subunit
VLALQGDVPEHRAAFERLLGPGSVVLVRREEDLARVAALAIPGGESTTLSRLLDDARLRRPLTDRIASGLPVLATCAGLILLSRQVEPGPGGRDPVPIPTLDIAVRRNDYGRQRESFESRVDVEGLPGPPFPGVFIRAPRILEVGANARAFARRGEEVVGVRSGPVWGLTFHPELSGDPRLHERFLLEALGGAQPK